MMVIIVNAIDDTQLTMLKKTLLKEPWLLYQQDPQLQQLHRKEQVFLKTWTYFVIKEGRKLRESGAHLEDMRNLKLKPIYEVAGTLDDIEIKVKVKS